MIYLDNNATTFLDPQVLAAIEPILSGKLGNPSSIHRYGQAARALLIKAAKGIAGYFGVQTSELVFTSGATEALNMVIRSTPKGSHIITSSLEHPAVLEPLKLSGCTVTYLEPKPGEGAICVQQIQDAIQPQTAMIVLAAANSETGVRIDLPPIGALAEKAGIDLVIDGVAILGGERWKMPRGVAAACFSGHKIHAPTGIGLAIVRNSMKKRHPFIVGGPQQHHMRGGTENLVGIIGFAKALSLIPASSRQIEVLRDQLEAEILSRLPDVQIHGYGQSRISNTSNMSFKGVDGETLLMQLDLAGIAVSHGSACSTGSLEPSRVLLNMGVPTAAARSSIRFSLSRFTTAKEIEQTLSVLVDIVNHLRSV